MLRLVAYAPDGPKRFPLGTGRILLGSDPECDISLDQPKVAPLHAVLRRAGGGVTVDSVGDASIAVNGVSGEHFALKPFDELAIGSLTIVLEETESAPNAVRDDQGSASAAPGGEVVGGKDEGEPDESSRTAFPSDPVQGVAMARQRLLEHLAQLSSWVLNDPASNRSLESVVAALNRDFGGGATYLFEDKPGSETSVKLVVTRDSAWVGQADDVLSARRRQAVLGPGRTLGHFTTKIGDESWLVCFRAAKALDRDYFGVIVVPPLPFDHWTPEFGFATVIDLIVLGLVHHVGRYEPILPGRREQRELTLAAGMTVGPSPRTEQLLVQMQAVADTQNNVLILGEPGTGRELVARSLHSSGPNRSGPFVALDCSSAEQAQLEADLFGAEVTGKTAPVRREGKAQLAADGTLFLRNVDRLPLELQGKVMNCLRSGVVYGPGTDEKRDVRFRVMATTHTGSLDGMRRADYRVDFANALCQLVVDVPALRERTEDLPLLLQTMVNRFTHETGRRVRGITTRALKALSQYDFPGNLVELENTVRQMIFLSTEQAPLDVDLLPAHIRKSAVLSRIDGKREAEGTLAEIVARVERQAIRDAMEESKGNKAKAARILGISRNGLAQKIRRHAL